MKIVSIIVTYNPDWNNVKFLIKQFNNQNSDFIVVDNSDKIYLGLAESNYIFIGGNIGIAAAQNMGILAAKSKGAEIIIFFDQDSQIKPDFIVNLTAPILKKNESIVCPIFKSIQFKFMYPVVRCNKYGVITKVIPEEKRCFYTNIAISSGTAVDVTVFTKVGLMNEELFIDYVDTEWCLRAASHGYKIFVNGYAEMMHEIGDETISLGKFKVPVHSPYRRYYRVRNSFKMLRLKHVPRLLVAREISFSLIHQILLVIMRPQKKMYLKFGLRGVIDGIYNRNGKL